jgi:hypothetical protein
VTNRHAIVHVVVIVSGQTQLLQVVFALGTTSGFASLLDGRQQQRHKNRDDRDHHQQFDQRETTPI